MRAAEKRCSKRWRTFFRSSAMTCGKTATASSMVSTMAPVMPSSMTSGTEPQRKASTGVPHAMASIMDNPNGSGQSMGNNSACASPRNCVFCSSLISPMNSTPGPRSSGSICTEINLIGSIHLGRDLERNTCGARNHNGAVGTLLRRYAAQERQVAVAHPPSGARQAFRDAVMDGGHEICGRYRPALRIGDRNQRHVVEADIKRVEIGQILAAVQRGNGAARDRSKQGEMKLIDMEMQNVEICRPLADTVKHQHVIGYGITDVWIEPQRLRHAGRECRRRH